MVKSSVVCDLQKSVDQLTTARLYTTSLSPPGRAALIVNTHKATSVLPATERSCNIVSAITYVPKSSWSDSSARSACFTAASQRLNGRTASAQINCMTLMFCRGWSAKHDECQSVSRAASNPKIVRMTYCVIYFAISLIIFSELPPTNRFFMADRSSYRAKTVRYILRMFSLSGIQIRTVKN